LAPPGALSVEDPEVKGIRDRLVSCVVKMQVVPGIALGLSAFRILRIADSRLKVDYRIKLAAGPNAVVDRCQS
jgi:hypothetical protein